MSGLILQTKAVKVENKGGGYNSKIRQKSKGTDYVVFNCPWPDCSVRNKQSMYGVKGSAGDLVSFKCNKCYREIEVSKPQSSPIVLLR